MICSASPIFDLDGKLLGVLDMSGDYRVANPHTLGMVVAAVNAIENQLRLQRATTKLYLAYRYSNILLENMSDGLISVDKRGLVTEINARGAEIFGVNPEHRRKAGPSL
jgi:sigma-54 dependent transcriptional regulator, acetoin dehydrogenase operon transcriptional activator AcoR